MSRPSVDSLRLSKLNRPFQYTLVLIQYLTITYIFAQSWDDSATGLIVGLTAYTTKQHIARATLEATCFQTKAILDAMDADQQATARQSSPLPSPSSSITSLSSSTTSSTTAFSIIPGTPCDGLGFMDKVDRSRVQRVESVFKKLKVDGGMTSSDVLLQLQADILGVQVERPEMKESVFLPCVLSNKVDKANNCVCGGQNHSSRRCVTCWSCAWTIWLGFV